MQSFIVEKIEFDFTDSMGTITEQEQEFITDNTLGLWHVTEEDQLVDFITGGAVNPPTADHARTVSGETQEFLRYSPSVTLLPLRAYQQT